MAWRLAAAAAISLFLNGLLLLRLDLSWLDTRSAPRRAVAMAPVSARDWEKNRAVRATPARPKERDPSGQVVSVPPAPPEMAPKDPARAKETRFLAERESAVEKETRSRHFGPGDGRPPVLALPGGKPGRPEASSSIEGPKKLTLDWKPKADSRGSEREGQGAPAPSAAPGPRGLPGADGSERKPDLRPGAAALQALAGLGSPDKIDGVDEGEGTFLNTRGFRYAGFFNRVKQEIWSPWSDELQDAIRARDPTGQRFMYRDRTTWLDVRLDAQGHLKNTIVIERSGADFLDEAARRAFLKVGVFANPPPGLVDTNGEIRFSFGFTINGASEAPTFRYRYMGQ